MSQLPEVFISSVVGKLWHTSDAHPLNSLQNTVDIIIVWRFRRPCFLFLLSCALSLFLIYFAPVWALSRNNNFHFLRWMKTSHKEHIILFCISKRSMWVRCCYCCHQCHYSEGGYPLPHIQDWSTRKLWHRTFIFCTLHTPRQAWITSIFYLRLS